MHNQMKKKLRFKKIKENKIKNGDTVIIKPPE